MIYFLKTCDKNRTKYLFRSSTCRQEDIDFTWMMYWYNYPHLQTDWQLNKIYSKAFKDTLSTHNESVFKKPGKITILSEDEVFFEIL